LKAILHLTCLLQYELMLATQPNMLEKEKRQCAVHQKVAAQGDHSAPQAKA
jgi:hypothetical protein